MLTIAIPKEDHLRPLATQVLRVCGLTAANSGSSQDLSASLPNAQFHIPAPLLLQPTHVIFLRTRDIISCLKDDVAQLGMIGKEFAGETNMTDLVFLTNLNVNAGGLYLISRDADPLRDLTDLKPGDRIYTQHPNLTTSLLLARGVCRGVEVKEVTGAARAFFAFDGRCRATVEMVAKEKGIKNTGLRFVEKLIGSSILVYTNSSSIARPSVRSQVYGFSDRAQLAAELLTSKRKTSGRRQNVYSVSGFSSSGPKVRSTKPRPARSALVDALDRRSSGASRSEIVNRHEYKGIRSETDSLPSSAATDARDSLGA